MFNAQEYINDTRNEIAAKKRTARWVRLVGYAAWVVVLALLITGVIKGLALAPTQYHSNPLTGIFARMGVSAWQWMNDNVPLLWAFLWTISPYPDVTQPLASPSSLGFLLWGYGLIAITIGLLKLSDFFYRGASELEKFLNQQAPLLLQIQSMIGQNIDISGDKNVVNAFNTINNMRERIEKKSWWNGPWGVIATGVATIAISKFLHLT
jgi:hypothetical protein